MSCPNCGKEAELYCRGIYDSNSKGWYCKECCNEIDERNNIYSKKMKQVYFKKYLLKIKEEIDNIMDENFNEFGLAFSYKEELKENENDIESIKSNLISAKKIIINLL